MSDKLSKNQTDINAVDLIQEALGSGPWHMEFDENANLISCFWSPVFRRMIGYKNTSDFPDELESFFNLLHEEDRERVVTHYWNAVKDYTGRTTYDIEYRLLTHNRGYRWFHAAGRVARREDGSPVSIVGFFIDINDKKTAEERLRLTNKARAEQLQILQSLANMYFSMHLINLRTDSVKEYSADGALRDFLAKDMGATRLISHVMENVVVPEYKKSALAFTDLTTLAKRMQGLKSLSSEFIGIHTGWFIANFITVEADRDGCPTVVLFTTQAIDETKKKEQVLFIRSVTDEMTGLLNRRAYEEELSYYRENPIDDDLVFISFDINRLKYVNDNLGHAAGDELIRGFSSTIKEYADKNAINAKIYRIGGDEFIAIAHISQEEFLKSEANLKKLFAQWDGRHVHKLDISYGCAFCRECPNYSIDDLAKLADKLMYKAKSNYYKSHGIDRRSN